MPLIFSLQYVSSICIVVRMLIQPLHSQRGCKLTIGPYGCFELRLPRGRVFQRPFFCIWPTSFLLLPKNAKLRPRDKGQVGVAPSDVGEPRSEERRVGK